MDVSGGKNHILHASPKHTNPTAEGVIGENGQIPLREPRKFAGSHHAVVMGAMRRRRLGTLVARSHRPRIRPTGPGGSHSAKGMAPGDTTRRRCRAGAAILAVNRKDRRWVAATADGRAAPT